MSVDPVAPGAVVIAAPWFPQPRPAAPLAAAAVGEERACEDTLYWCARMYVVLRRGVAVSRAAEGAAWCGYVPRTYKGALCTVREVYGTYRCMVARWCVSAESLRLP